MRHFVRDRVIGWFIYRQGLVCRRRVKDDYKDKSKLVSYEPEIVLRFGESRDPDELEYYWTEYRKQTGSKMRDMYKEYVQLTNKAAR